MDHTIVSSCEMRTAAVGSSTRYSSSSFDVVKTPRSFVRLLFKSRLLPRSSLTPQPKVPEFLHSSNLFRAAKTDTLVEFQVLCMFLYCVKLQGSSQARLITCPITRSPTELSCLQEFWLRLMIFCCNSGVQAKLPDQPTYLASLQRKVEQILLDIKNLSYVQAAELLQSLKQELWPCHKTTPLQLWIDVHLYHVLLRAAVASLSNTESFLVRAFQGFTTCIDKPFYYSSFVRTLKVSACLGRAWMHLLKGEIDEAQQDIRNSEGYSMDSTALATRTTHANWAMAASCFMAGDLGGVEDFLKKVGYDIESLTDMYQIGAMDCQVLRMKGSFNDAVTMSAQLVLRDNPFNDKDTMPISTCKRMRQLQLGVIGNIWFALGAYMEAMQVRDLLNIKTYEKSFNELEDCELLWCWILMCVVRS